MPVDKFVLLSVCTFGLYQFYWIYVTWARLAKRERLALSPFWRTTLAGLWNFDLFPKLKTVAEREGVPVEWAPNALALVFLVLSNTWHLPGPWSWLGLGSTFALVPVVATVAKLPSSRGRVVGYTLLNLVAIAFGALLLAFALYWDAFDPLGLGL